MRGIRPDGRRRARRAVIEIPTFTPGAFNNGPPTGCTSACLEMAMERRSPRMHRAVAAALCTLAMLKAEARAYLVKALHPTTFTPPALGAHGYGYKGLSGPLRAVRGLWSDSSSLRIVAIGLKETRKKAAVAQLEKIAATAVPAFGL